MKIISFLSIILFAALCGASPSFAAPTVSIAPSGDGVFVLQCTGFEGVGAMDIVLTYDVSTLRSPQVAQGVMISGAYTAVNTNVPGKIVMPIARLTPPINGSGTIATITFVRTGNSPGSILSLTATLSSVDEKPIPTLTQVINPATTTASDSSSEKKETTSQSGSDSTGQQTAPTGLVVVTVGGGSPEKKEGAPSPSPADVEQQVQAPEPAERAKDTIARAAEPAPMKAPEKKYLSHKSVLDRFREYKGARTAKALTALFEQDKKAPFRQEPAVLLPDGAATVKVYFSLDVSAEGTPELAMIAGTLLSLKRDGGKPDAWVAGIRPAKGESAAQLIVAGSDTALEIPLALAPKVNVDLDKSAKVTAADFSLFLKKRGTQKAPAFDLNNDGRRDFVDDYLFTANYLAVAGKQPVQKKKS